MIEWEGSWITGDLLFVLIVGLLLLLLILLLLLLLSHDLVLLLNPLQLMQDNCLNAPHIVVIRPNPTPSLCLLPLSLSLPISQVQPRTQPTVTKGFPFDCIVLHTDPLECAYLVNVAREQHLGVLQLSL